MTTPYDEFYKRFFSEPIILQELLCYVFNEDWICELDFNSLEKLDKEYISSSLSKSSNDMLWKVRWYDKNIYLLVMLEFQSSIDQFMALRVLNYVSELYLTLLRTDKNIMKKRLLPPVLPLVIYSGDKKWTAAKDMCAFFVEDMPTELLKYQPNIRYWLLSELNHKIDASLAPTSLLLLLLKLEQSQNLEEFIVNAQYLKQHIAADAVEVWQDFLLYIKYILKEETFFNVKSFRAQEEVGMLRGTLYERVRGWEKELVAKGVQQGIEQGVQQGIEQGMEQGVLQGVEQGIKQGMHKGIHQGELAVIIKMLETKFGKISKQQLRQLNILNTTQLLQLTSKIIKANTLEEVLTQKEEELV